MRSTSCSTGCADSQPGCMRLQAMPALHEVERTYWSPASPALPHCQHKQQVSKLEKRIMVFGVSVT